MNDKKGILSMIMAAACLSILTALAPLHSVQASAVPKTHRPLTDTDRNALPVTAMQDLRAGLLKTYFSESLFIGDSVMTGYEYYCRHYETGPVKNAQFLASGSLSAHNALWTISSASVHPVYMGEKRYLWDSVRMIAPRRAFFFLGLNDMNMGTDTVERYEELIGKILEGSPDLEIHIISTTYTLAGASSGRLTNSNIREFNAVMQELAEEKGWGFIDLAEPLSDGHGNLLPAYCSDRYVHHTNAAYAVWTRVLTEYASGQVMPAGRLTFSSVSDK